MQQNVIDNVVEERTIKFIQSKILHSGYLEKNTAPMLQPKITRAQEQDNKETTIYLFYPTAWSPWAKA
jgi:hypothetical protein